MNSTYVLGTYKTKVWTVWFLSVFTSLRPMTLQCFALLHISKIKKLWRVIRWKDVKTKLFDMLKHVTIETNNMTQFYTTKYFFPILWTMNCLDKLIQNERQNRPKQSHSLDCEQSVACGQKNRGFLKMAYLNCHRSHDGSLMTLQSL